MIEKLRIFFGIVHPGINLELFILSQNAHKGMRLEAFAVKEQTALTNRLGIIYSSTINRKVTLWRYMDERQRVRRHVLVE
jgi:hypothetical protein